MWESMGLCYAESVLKNQGGMKIFNRPAGNSRETNVQHTIPLLSKKKPDMTSGFG